MRINASRRTGRVSPAAPATAPSSFFQKRTGLALDPEDAEVALVVKLEQLLLVDGPHAELTLDGANQRRALG